MPSLFTKIIEGELPARFVWKDDVCVAFLTIAPLKPGHVLVVPRQEIDHWLDADDGVMAHLMEVAARVGRAQQDVFSPVRIGMMIVGLEIPHLHIHAVPIEAMHDMDFARADQDTAPEALDETADRLRSALGWPEPA